MSSAIHATHLKQVQAYSYRGELTYLVIYNAYSGKKDRYTVLVPTCDDPVVIGRELSFRDSQCLIRDYENLFKGKTWLGYRSTVLRCRKQVSAQRMRKGTKE